MGIAYSEGTVVYTTPRSDTSAHFLADLDAALTSAGWSGAAITGGTKYTIASPQGLQCKVKIFDDGATVFGGWHYLTVQFLSVDETLLGFAHKLLYGVPDYEAYGYELVANQCQLFVALRGITQEGVIGSLRHYSVAGGIPYVPSSVDPECAASAGPDAAVSRIFWSCGDAVFNTDFRNSRYCTSAYSYCLNGAVTVKAAASSEAGPENPYTGALQLYPLTMTGDADAWYLRQPRIVKYKSGDPLYLHPFIGWGFKIQGQLWDAFMVSRDTTLDEIVTTRETDAGGGTRLSTWLAWNYQIPSGEKGGGGTWFATLYLLKGTAASGIWNYAY